MGPIRILVVTEYPNTILTTTFLYGENIMHESNVLVTWVEIMHTYYILKFVKFGNTIYQILGHLTYFDELTVKNLKILNIINRVTKLAHR